jgi:glutathione S-transferase
MVDKTSGKDKRLFEGGAMLLYLTDRYDKDNKISFDHDSDEYWETVEWIVWMQSGLGPMQVGEPSFYHGG